MRALGALALVAVVFGAAGCGKGTAAATPTTTAAATPVQKAAQLIQAGLKAETTGDTVTATKDFTAAAATDPTSAIAYYDLGVLAQQGKNNTGAIAEYNKAVLADATYKPALFNLAILQTVTDPASAIVTYGKILTLKPDDPNTLFNLGLLLISQHQAAAGHADLKKSIQLTPALRTRVPKGITP